LIFDAETHQIIGGGIVGTHAGDMIGEVCLAIEMGCDAVDIGKTIHPHPTLGESIGMAAEVAHGTCTDCLRNGRNKVRRSSWADNLRPTGTQKTGLGICSGRFFIAGIRV